MNSIVGSDGLRISFLVSGRLGNRLALSHGIRPFFEPILPQLEVVLSGRWARVHEDQVRDPLWILQSVFERNYRAPGMSQQGRGLQMEKLSDLFEVSDIGGECDIFGSDIVGRLPASALIVVDEAVRIGEPVHLRQ